MKLLPHWVIPNKYPALLDHESATALEQTARLYGAMNELIEEYNAFVDSTNEKITEFMESSDKNYELFTVGIRQEFQDFIDVIELKIQSQDAVIADAVKDMKDNLTSTLQDLLTYMVEAGELNVNYVYDADTESLDINMNFA